MRRPGPPPKKLPPIYEAALVRLLKAGIPRRQIIARFAEAKEIGVVIHSKALDRLVKKHKIDGRAAARGRRERLRAKGFKDHGAGI